MRQSLKNLGKKLNKIKDQYEYFAADRAGPEVLICMGKYHHITIKASGHVVGRMRRSRQVIFDVICMKFDDDLLDYLTGLPNTDYEYFIMCFGDQEARVQKHYDLNNYIGPLTKAQWCTTGGFWIS